MAHRLVCSNCGSDQVTLFYKLTQVPVHSVVLMRSRQEALAIQCGDINLGFCDDCGFIGNFDFREDLLDYAAEYESTQAYSPQFNTFHQKLANHLISRYDLRNKDIIEIGCGHGEFLKLLCRLGDNRGVGFDPAHRRNLDDDEDHGSVRFISNYYSENYAHMPADFIMSKMTMEHIFETRVFARQLRGALSSNGDAIVYIQVPDATRILKEAAFWDIHYEHCCYFTEASLSAVFRDAGFDIIDVRNVYFDTYLTIEAKPRTVADEQCLEGRGSLAEVRTLVEEFKNNIHGTITGWVNSIRAMHEAGRRLVIWGSSSKATAFLSTLGIKEEIAYVVDINPIRQGTFMAGTGQEIVAPEFLRTYQPHDILVINPIYCEEVQEMIDTLEVTARILTPQRIA